MATVISPPEQRVVLNNVAWETYERLLADHLDSSAPRFTYDRGVLEIVSPSVEHEEINRTLATIVVEVAKARRIRFRNFGSMTVRRPSIERGFEADSCFYIRRVEQVRGRRDIDLSIDPSPDLIIEVDVTRSSLDRFPIYAQLDDLEVWRYERGRVSIHVLVDGTYQEADVSLALPPVTSAMLTRFVEDSELLDPWDWSEALLEWVRTHSAG